MRKQPWVYAAGLIVVVMLFWSGATTAQTVIRRIELGHNEQAEVACPPGHQIAAMPKDAATLQLSCLAGTGETPSPTAVAATGTHPAGCKPNEVFNDSQDWWLHDDPSRNFGHLHTQVCFPVNAQIDEPYDITVVSLLHNNPGRFYRLMMQSYSGGLDGDELLCNDTTAVVCKNFNRSLERCEESGGQLLDNGMTCRWSDRFTIDPQTIGASGWQQFRFRAFVSEPDGTRMATSTSLHATVINDQPPSKLYQEYGTYNYLRGRGWYTGAQYASAFLLDAERLKRPISGIWRPTVHFTPGANHDGTPPAPITGHFAALDTNFHANQRGIVLLEGEGEFHGQLTIDTTKLSNGWHRLFLRADQAMPDGHIHSGVLATWFEVKNPE